MIALQSFRARLILAFVASITSIILLLSFGFSDSFSNYRAQDAFNYLRSGSGHSTSRASRQIYNCADPYRSPGYLYINPNNYRDTRWIPYTSQFFDAPEPRTAKYPPPADTEFFFDFTPAEPEFLDSASTPQQWMHLALAEGERRRKEKKGAKTQTPADFLDMKDQGHLGWLWGRRVLMVGDSVDRFMIQWFCQEFSGSFHYPEMHKNTVCDIPTFNLTLVHWHSAGSVTQKPSWWFHKTIKIAPFEERFQEIWSPLISSHLRGLNGRPDLILWQNGIWDRTTLVQTGLSHSNRTGIMGKADRQIVWEEMRFLGARYKKFISMIEGEFGHDTPIMFRSLSVDRKTADSEMQLFEMDRLERAAAEWAGHEVFEWGRIITAFGMLYKDIHHVNKGPASWLWGNMILEYIARSAAVGDKSRAPYFDGWSACHEDLVHWGGR